MRLRILGAVNQNMPGIPFWYDCCTLTKRAGAQIRVTAIEIAPSHQGTLLPAAINPSALLQARPREAEVVRMIMIAAKQIRNT